MINPEIRRFLEKFAAGNHTEQEHERFVNWLSKAPIEEVDAVAGEYQAMLEKGAGGRHIPDAALVKKIESRLDEVADTGSYRQKTAVWFVPRRTWGIAASVAGLIIMLAGLYTVLLKKDTRKQPLAFLEKTVPLNDTAIVWLEDGTKMVLNGGTTLQYPPHFTGSSREVFLSGEAYVEVAHKDNHPFIIHTRHLDILDLGTIFNVKAYPGDKTTEATLLEGSIEVVVRKDTARKVILKPHEKVVFHSADTMLTGVSAIQEEDGEKAATASRTEPVFEITSVIPATTDKIIEETAWLNDLLVFQNRTFGELAAKMESRYNVRILFKDAGVQQYRYTGVFREETVTQALDELQLSRPFRYTVQKDTIIIYK